MKLIHSDRVSALGVTLYQREKSHGVLLLLLLLLLQPVPLLLLSSTLLSFPNMWPVHSLLLLSISFASLSSTAPIQRIDNAVDQSSALSPSLSTSNLNTRALVASRGAHSKKSYKIPMGGRRKKSVKSKPKKVSKLAGDDPGPEDDLRDGGYDG